MSTITIPKEMTGGADLVVLPRAEYERLVRVSKISEFAPTALQMRILNQARKNRLSGKTLSLHELKKKLGVGD